MENDVRYLALLSQCKSLLYGGLIGSVLSHTMDTTSNKNYYLSCFELCRNFSLYIAGKPSIDPTSKNPNRAKLLPTVKTKEELHEERPRWREGFKKVWEYLATNHRKEREYDSFISYTFSVMLKTIPCSPGEIDYTRVFAMAGIASLLTDNNTEDLLLSRYITQPNYRNTPLDVINIIEMYIKILKLLYTRCNLSTHILLSLEYSKKDHIIYPIVNLARLIALDSSSENIDIQIYGKRDCKYKNPLYTMCLVLAILWKHWNSSLDTILDELKIYSRDEIVFVMVVQLYLLKNIDIVDTATISGNIGIGQYRYMEDYKYIEPLSSKLATEIYLYRKMDI